MRKHSTNREDDMERDVVCGMEVDPKTAAAKTEQSGRTYYFCSEQCKKQFDADPKKYGA
jgi:YHS domain-containing protein